MSKDRNEREEDETQPLTLTMKHTPNHTHTHCVEACVLALCFHSQKCKWGAAEPDGAALLLVNGQRERERKKERECGRRTLN